MRPLFLVPLALLAVASARAADLTVGSKAPALKVAKWVKGEPIAAFEPGKVYVVEFWATWCGPCKVSIPHLSDLAKKYKDKVAFTGVAVWESAKEDYDTKVPQFVTEMGDKMAYRVATDDDTPGTMAKTWMEAAGENGIPASFVIDQKGEIAWIGHPMDGLDEVLDKVVAGTWNGKEFAAQRAAQKAAEVAERAERIEAFAGINAAIKANDPKKAIEEIDKAIPAYPKFADPMRMMKFSFLLNVDEKAAYPFAEELAAGPFAKDANALNSLAWDIAENPKLKTPNYPLAVRLAERAVAIAGEKNWMVLDTLAWAQFKAGDKVKALANEKKAVAMAKAEKADAATLKELQDRLTEIEKP
ncbi:redoxin domain-containing protein [bacterium]|nr:MAG: redoxin domain-containing protein [bacterium]